MALRKAIVDYLFDYLKLADFKDYCPNGLQVEGRPEIHHLISGVTASQALIEKAIDENADAILVHHGYFWKGEEQTITGIKQKRIKALLEKNINLLAYHLPLDTHPDVGNNAQLARILDIEVTGSESLNGVNNLLWTGRLPQPQAAAELNALISSSLGRQALHLESASNRTVETIAWCTGGAQGYLQQAAELGVDAYLSGEVSEPSYHLAKELDIHFFAAGHHATERYGVQALAAHLEEKFAVTSSYIEIENPV